MAIDNRKSRDRGPGDADDASNVRWSKPYSGGPRNAPGYDQPAPNASFRPSGSLPARSPGTANDRRCHPGTSAAVRSPYVKPAFECDIVFSRALMRPTPGHVAA